MVDSESLLMEIRDLLVPISSVARAQLATEGPERLRTVVGSGQRRRAAALMDGTQTRAQIQSRTGINAPNLSTLIKDLREMGLVTEKESKPRLSVGPSGIWTGSKQERE